MLTVPEVAERVGKNPETVRRWIRSGRLRARKVGTQHVIEEADLEAADVGEPESLPVPEDWKYAEDGSLIPDPVPLLHEARRGR
jgi:excisionase family DNA binding protein